MVSEVLQLRVKRGRGLRTEHWVSRKASSVAFCIECLNNNRVNPLKRMWRSLCNIYSPPLVNGTWCLDAILFSLSTADVLVLCRLHTGLSNPTSLSHPHPTHTHTHTHTPQDNQKRISTHRHTRRAEILPLTFTHTHTHRAEILPLTFTHTHTHTHTQIHTHSNTHKTLTSAHTQTQAHTSICFFHSFPEIRNTRKLKI